MSPFRYHPALGAVALHSLLRWGHRWFIWHPGANIKPWVIASRGALYVRFS